VARRKVWARTDYQETMSFRLKQGLIAVVTLCTLAACNTYTPDLLESGDAESTDDGGETSDATLTTGSGGSTGNLTTTINSTTSTNSSTSGGDGGGGSDTTSSPSETSTDGGGTGGGSSTGSSNTDTDTTSTTTTASTDTGGSGGGGTGGSGGSGGSGGATSTTSNPVNPLLIDDFEDGDSQLETPTYSGYWFTAVDDTGTGEVLPAPGGDCEPEDLDPPRDDSDRAMHVSGTWNDGAVWIAALGFPLKNGGTEEDPEPVDASVYDGVTFYAKTDEEDTQVRLEVMITDVKDNAHFAIDIDLSSTWELYTVTWDDPRLIQPAWTTAPVDFEAAHLYKFQFQFESETFDLWVDDISFFEL